MHIEGILELLRILGNMPQSLALIWIALTFGTCVSYFAFGAIVGALRHHISIALPEWAHYIYSVLVIGTAYYNLDNIYLASGLVYGMAAALFMPTSHTKR